MDQQLLEKMIKDALCAMNLEGGVSAPAGETQGVEGYPLSKKQPEKVQSATGKKLNDITMEGVMSGAIHADDCRIAPETLEKQAQIAESINRHAFAGNLRRAAELIAVPDDRILEIYNALRPYRSTKAEMIAIAEELEGKYNAVINGKLVREAADMYEKRGRLKQA